MFVQAEIELKICLDLIHQPQSGNRNDRDFGKDGKYKEGKQRKGKERNKRRGREKKGGQSMKRKK